MCPDEAESLRKASCNRLFSASVTEKSSKLGGNFQVYFQLYLFLELHRMKWETVLILFPPLFTKMA